MSNEIIQAGQRGLALRSLDDMQRWAEGVKASGLAPKSLSSSSQILVATQYGLELGLTPMAALNSIAVIGNKPSLYGDAALALVRKSGLCEYVKERIEGTGDGMMAVCESKRKNEEEPVIRTFSVKNARQAKLWGKSGPWTTHPERMLTYKARAFCLRDLYSDVLMGLHLYEELQGEEDIVHDPPTCNTPKRQDRRTVESQEVTSQEEPTTPPADTDGITEEDAGGTSEEDFLDTTYEPVVDDDEPGSEAALALIPSVKDAFFEMLGKKPEDCEKPNVMFVATCAMALSCPEEDCNRPDKFSVNMLNKVQGWIDSQKDGE